MDTFWFLLVVFLAFFLVLVILPNIVATPPLPLQRIPSPPPRTDVSYPEIANDQDPAQLRKQWEQAEALRSKQMLDQQFVPATKTIPVDHPRKPIGACPFSKPFSSDLPIADMPMQFTATSEDMRMGSWIA